MILIERDLATKTLPVAIVIFVSLYLAKAYNYLLFHSIAELFCVVIALTIFVIYLNTYEHFTTGFYGIIGAVYCCTGVLDFLHALSYRGMNIFPGYDTNLPTSLWIAARYLEALGILTGFLLIHKKPKKEVVLGGFVLITLALVGAIFTNIFPVCFEEGAGLTRFKVVSEYVICLILTVVIYLAYHNRRAFHKQEIALIVGAAMITIAAELSFTLYVDPYGFFNMVGHFLKIISYYLIYRAVVTTCLHRPYVELLDTKETLSSALKEKNILLQEAHHRVKNNLQNIMVILQMQQVKQGDEHLAATLHPVIRRVKSLGILHELMYQSPEVGGISFREYLNDMVEFLCKATPDKQDKVLLEGTGGELLLSLSEAVPVGMATYEIIASSLRLDDVRKEKNSATLKVSAAIDGKGRREILLQESGVAHSSSVCGAKQGTLGKNLVKSYVSQAWRATAGRRINLRNDLQDYVGKIRGRELI